MSEDLAMPSPGKTGRGTIAGPVGKLECMASVPTETPRGIAVTCHPHPLHGGAMGNKVVYALDAVAQKLGMATARFNFRGVGASQGTHDNAQGEIDDCLSVVEWMRSSFPEQPLLLSGFSFGAYVALAAAHRAEPKVLVSVAPPFGRYFERDIDPPHPECPWLVVHARDDDVVDFAETQTALAQYTPGPALAPMEEGGHFFHGRLQDIRDAVSPFVECHWLA